ncbi:MAG: hypothetical protein KDD45_09760, partial [Bdellovibrionales bacterium]|nr:hypothetical protein [Bdellovibrionales bacterium]
KISGFIPPLAKGISGMTIVCCLNTFSATTGALKVREGMFLIPLGLFSASNLSANVPCFSPFESFLIAY